MNNYFISGIQQVGVGTSNFTEAWRWYIKMFQVDIKILEDDTVAERMLPYTGNKPQKRHACIAVNLQGGGGFEIWQYSQRTPQPCGFDINVGDLGIFAAKIKSKNVAAFREELLKKYDNIGPLAEMPDGTKTFILKAPWNNYFQVVEDKYLYIDRNQLSGGTVGAMIGVTDIEKSLSVYRDVLGYDTVVYDVTGNFDDLKFMNGGEQKFRRVLLKSSQK
ncbi:MAG: VOC family protein, partial [Bacteroidales bacterium]|nr:VOC family protein [Bacteroidales bacterium]